MNFEEYWQILVKKRKQTLFLFVFLAFSLTLSLTFFVEPKYEAHARIFVKQNETEHKDAYNVARTNKYFTDIFTEVLLSDLFFGLVVDSGFNINESLLGESSDKQILKWQRSNNVKAIGNTGIIKISSYSSDKYQAEEINEAITHVYQTEHQRFHGFNEKISVEVLNNTIVSNWPTKPNILLNAVMGVVVGLIIGSIFVYLYPATNLQLLNKVSDTHKRKMKTKTKNTPSKKEYVTEKKDLGVELDFKSRVNLKSNRQEKAVKQQTTNKQTFLNSNLSEKLPEGNMNNLF